MTNNTMTAGQAEDTVLQLQYDLVEIARTDLGMHEVDASRIAAALVVGLRKRYGGERLGRRGLYIPAPSKQERNEAIRRDFDGTNGEEVMKRHSITRSTLYRVIGRRNGIGVCSAAAPK